MENYKIIKRFDNSPEANMAKSFLIENGIEAILQDEHAGEIFNPVVKGIKLNVPVEQFEKAKQLIDCIDLIKPEDHSEVIDILEDCDALQTGHFRLTSGLHSNKYVEKIKVIQHPDKVSKLAKLFAVKLADVEADIVIGLAMGGIVLGFEVARVMKKKFAFTQRKEGKMTIRQGFDVYKGMKAIVIEDIVTTGGSVKEVLDMLSAKGIDVQAIGLLVDRTGGSIDFGVRTESLLKLKIEACQPTECQSCKDDLPISIPGSSDK